ncbi:hypothetical protein N0V93_002080 [Gnomoniopsis smithogilvyi]|uniref:Uncharacterized protein n=1 Tax=Gnomoniopsis smithogilvyi TaxID=1191159 RepID=A0A9W8Z502_9PEZI|nr:hypothetical protein N0V93_002080 [Gnomoniopsis smithogilvyi]
MDRISGTSAEKAKSVLIALCTVDPSLRSRAQKLLDAMDSLESVHSVEKKGKKRKAESTIKICTKCQDPFYEEENSSKACRYHSGSLEVDDSDDGWADHDEDCHGTIDTDEMRMEFPEGFVWDCCGKPGYRLGCTRGYHDATSSHRGRYGRICSGVKEKEDSSDARTSELEDENDLEEEISN